MSKNINDIEVIEPLILKPIKITNMKNTANIFKSSDKFWIDENDVQIPYNRTTKVERLMERSSARIVKKALILNRELKAFNELISKLSQEAYEAFMKNKGVEGKKKGNFTWYNFDRSVKIEINVNEPIVFDDLTITAAREKFYAFMEKELDGVDDFVKELIIDAFTTQRSGKLDTSKIMSLTRHESKVNKPLFSEAVKLIHEAIRRPKSKTYRRVWIKNEAGKYENIELNLSSL